MTIKSSSTPHKLLTFYKAQFLHKRKSTNSNIYILRKESITKVYLLCLCCNEYVFVKVTPSHIVWSCFRKCALRTLPSVRLPLTRLPPNLQNTVCGNPEKYILHCLYNHCDIRTILPVYHSAVVATYHC